jgi:hypothetical protein
LYLCPSWRSARHQRHHRKFQRSASAPIGPQSLESLGRPVWLEGRGRRSVDTQSTGIIMGGKSIARVLRGASLSIGPALECRARLQASVDDGSLVLTKRLTSAERYGGGGAQGESSAPPGGYQSRPPAPVELPRFRDGSGGLCPHQRPPRPKRNCGPLCCDRPGGRNQAVFPHTTC